MTQYKSRKCILILLDIAGIILSFLLAVVIRYCLLVDIFGSVLSTTLYGVFLIGAAGLYLCIAVFRHYTPLERLSVREIIIQTVQHQTVFIGAYIILFYVFPQAFLVSRAVVGIFFVLSIILCSALRIIYRIYCVQRIRLREEPESKKSRRSDISA